jgi:hypothetical protein
VPIALRLAAIGGLTGGMGPKVSEAWLVWAATFVATMVVQTRIGWRVGWTMRWRWLANARRGLANAREEEERARDHADHAHADRYCRRCPVNADAVCHDATQSTVGRSVILRQGADDGARWPIVCPRHGQRQGAHRSIDRRYGPSQYSTLPEYWSRPMPDRSPWRALRAAPLASMYRHDGTAFGLAPMAVSLLSTCSARLGSARLGFSPSRLGLQPPPPPGT